MVGSKKQLEYSDRENQALVADYVGAIRVQIEAGLHPLPTPSAPATTA
jgi:hypothetical protein